MITSRIRQSLQDRSSDSYARLQVLEAKASPLLEYAQGGTHLTFTTHGVSHVSAVEQNYDWLLSDKDLAAFTVAEMFCLLCATVFHDALMIPRRIGDEAAARAKHIQRARDFLHANYEALTLSRHDAEAVSEIIRGHGVDNIGDLPSQRVLGNTLVNLQKLGACLSMADICHADSSRAPEIVFKHLDLDYDSAYHWRRHLQISGITRVDDKLLMSALTFSDAGDAAVSDYRDLISAQLKIVRPYFDTVLSPIRDVKLDLKRLESPLEQTLRFSTNTPAILKLLVEGVYDRLDVFVRELVQNSLDACTIRRARLAKRAQYSYNPNIVLTVYTESGRTRALRIDDNGAGMDLTDVQDTLLWIGSSISTNAEVAALLRQTTRQHLIATFGIGLLSCFKVSRHIEIRSAKERATPLEFLLTGISDNIIPKKSKDDSLGTTALVQFMDDVDVDIYDAAYYYFRRVEQANIQILTLEWSDDSAQLPRHEIFTIATTEAVPVDPHSYSADSPFVADVSSETFTGRLWLPPTVEEMVDADGALEILLEGVYIGEDPSSDWLPRHFRSCSGYINFAAGSITVPAGRDRVIHDDHFREHADDLANKTTLLINRLVEATGHPTSSEFTKPGLVLSYLFREAEARWKLRIIRELDNVAVMPYKAKTAVLVKDIAAKTATVYFEYKTGRWLSELGTFGEKKLWHAADDFVELQASLLTQSQEVVLSVGRLDLSTEGQSVLESAMLSAYFADKNVKAVDLCSENVIGGRQALVPKPESLRDPEMSIISFVEIPGLRNRMAWSVGKEVWLNISHPAVSNVYDTLLDDSSSANNKRIAEDVILMLGYRFDQVLDRLLTVLQRRRTRA